MSRAVFVDTSGWLAAASTRESRHAEMAAAHDDLAKRRVPLVTTNLVLAEMHVLIVRERGARAGCALLDALYTDPLYRVISATRELESEATDRWLRPCADHRFSLTNAVSFEVMRVERIEEALALDHHFEVAGYRLLPPPASRLPGRRRSARR
ncbi:MAG: type II toxin-antitoxin system VapC family toxin [Gemmatimonadaceae bacterium]